MDQVTQQNAALVEEAAAAAGSLQEQASGLSQVVSVFKLNDEPASLQLRHQIAPPRSAAPRPARHSAAPKQPLRAKAAIAAPQRQEPAMAGGGWEEF
jgi:hypothetical protein